MNQAPGKKVAVVGLGKTGSASARFLHGRGFKVFVTEKKVSAEIESAAAGLRGEGIEVEIGPHDLKRLAQSDWVLLSPGIGPGEPWLQEIESRRVPVFSEIEAASWFSQAACTAAVTGTAGKTTVSTLLYQMLKRANRPVHLCGNIGNPWIGEVDRISSRDTVVLELSSFQLRGCRTFRPSVGVLLNLSENHLDWHPDMGDYVASKLKLFQNQRPGDVAVLRRQDEARYFPDFRFQSSKVYYDTSSIPANEACLRELAKILSCPFSAVDSVLRDFKGIEHRLETVREIEGIRFVNDSKCTTTLSLKWALEHFKDGSVMLIAGGKPKEKDFGRLGGLVRKKVRHLFLIGEARKLMRDAWKECAPVSECTDLETAVESSFEQARRGETILLSPACASFDMFRNYEDRGQRFKQIVNQLGINV